MIKKAHFILLPTLDCNLGCEYCFSEKKCSYMTEEQIYPLMNKIKALSLKLNFTDLSFYFQGGEVLLLNPAWFETMFKISSYLFNHNEKLRVKYSMQSNITLYHPGWADIIHKIFNGHLSTSFDYPNQYRRELGRSQAEFEKIWLKKRNKILEDNLSLGLISLLNHKSIAAGAENFYTYYVDQLGIKDFSINLPFSINPDQKYHLDNDQLAQFLATLFHIWFERGYQKEIHIRPFENLIQTISSPGQKALICNWSANCGHNFFSIGPDGSIGLCDCWVTAHAQLSFGNIFTDSVDEIIQHPNRQLFLQRLDAVLNSDCLECPYCALCFGGCALRSYMVQSDLFKKDYYCPAYQALFKTALQLAGRDRS